MMFLLKWLCPLHALLDLNKQGVLKPAIVKHYLLTILATVFIKQLHCVDTFIATTLSIKGRCGHFGVIKPLFVLRHK